MLPAPAFLALAASTAIIIAFAELEKFGESIVGPSIAGFVAPSIYLPLVAIIAPKWKEKIVFTLAEFGIAGLIFRAFFAFNTSEISSMLGWNIPILLCTALGIIVGGITGFAIARRMVEQDDGINSVTRSAPHLHVRKNYENHNFITNSGYGHNINCICRYSNL
jgi:Kef-type K+ transport system membrane component KefB